MMAGLHRALTAEERQQRLDSLQAQIGDQVANLTTSQAWTDYLKVAARFHQYSFQNQLLILQQKPDAIEVAGYRRWQAMDNWLRFQYRRIVND